MVKNHRNKARLNIVITAKRYKDLISKYNKYRIPKNIINFEQA